ncbi:hypothetical protein V5735_03410 (plasmid) [Haladaptatus sp. SPP-AMP-3]|uniref:DUF7563 family protein n=1 Tax=Haladaptatus sp. SPP-AMP-3 TaxID=3121295 RepID=UPI003C2C9861
MVVRLPSAAPSERTTCDYCDAHVTTSFRRTYGTEENRAKRCPECDSWARIMRGSAQGRDVEHPDPQTHTERRGGKQLREKVIDGGVSQ